MGKMRKFAVGAGIAAATGYLAGLLTAPKSGKETRQDIKQATEKGKSEAEQQLTKLHNELDAAVTKAKALSGKTSGKAKKELDTVVSTGETVREKLNGLMGMARKDKAMDKDLKKAVADAQAAIEHLRKYLSK